MTFRKATEGDIPNIVKLLADDELGSKREDYKAPLPNSYYDAFQNILQDKNQELIILENFNLKYIYNPTNKKPHECGNNYKCNFIPIWLSLNPNAL